MERRFDNRRPPPQGDSTLAGVLLVAGAAAMWSLNGALIKLMDREGAHGVVIAFYRSLIAGLFLWPVARGKFGTLRPRARVGSLFGSSSADNPPVSPLGKGGGQIERRSKRASGLRRLVPLRQAAILCVFAFTLMTVCFVVANTMTQAANVIFLQYTSTLWIFGLSPWLLKERPRRSDFWLLAMAMVGIGIIFAGSASATLGGLLVALGSGLFYGLLSLAIRQMRDSDSAAVTVVNNLGAALLLLIPATLVGGLMLSPRGWVLITIMGVLQFGVPYYLYALGLVRIPAYRAALITLLEPVLVPVWTYLAVGEEVLQETMIGGAIILVALLLLFKSAREKQSAGEKQSVSA